MIEWFKNLGDAEKIAIVVPVGLALIGGLFALLKWIFGKSDGNNVLDRYGKTKEELGQANERIRQLEAQLAQPSREMTVAEQQSIPVPSREAKELAKLINEDDGLYAQALKAIAEGNTEQADEMLDETQQFLDQVQEQKDLSQVKIYWARMQNALYGGKFREALGWCEKLEPLAGDDPQILGNLAVVYCKNALYRKAEPLMRRALAIDEASLGKDHPNVAIHLNNLAGLLQDTNRFAEAEPLIRRALAIGEASLGE
ncbi:MAG: tetratricopeptide repeat protein, partial [Planctomycetota bacterium]